MSTSQDEIIELIELNSNASSQSKPRKRSFPNNKVGSPSVQSPVTTPTRENSETSDVFLAKKTIPPVPKPRKSKLKKPSRSSPEFSETSTNYDRLSYRERIKERFKTVKQSASKVEKLPRLKGEARRVVNLNRSIDAIRRENSDIERDLRRRQERDNGREKTEVTRLEKYAFFCLTNSQADLEEERADLKESNAKSTEKLVGDKVVEYCRPEDVQFLLELAQNEDIWCPNKAVPIEVCDKLGVESLRDLAEEGLYVCQKPNVNKSELKLIEKRLLNDDKPQKWFDCTGRLNALEDPHNGRSFRPTNAEVSQDLTEFSPPCKGAPEAPLESVLVTQENTLDIHVHSLKFTHHPLFSAEHVLREELLHHYDIYRSLITRSSVERTCKRIDALQQAVKRIEDSSMAAGDSSGKEKPLESYRLEIRTLMELMLVRSKERRENAKRILETWRNIRRVREVNGFSTTSVQLSIRKEKTDYDHDKKLLKRRIQENLNNELKLQQLNSDSEPNLEELKTQIETRFKFCLKPPGEPQVHFSISHDHEVTTAVEDAKEQQRKAAVSSTRIHFKLLCNEMLVCKSKPVSLNDTFTCVFDESVSVQLRDFPETVSVDIYEQPGDLLKRRIATVKLSWKNCEANFEKDEILHYKHSGMGSGVQLSGALDRYGITVHEDRLLSTRGFLNFNLERAGGKKDEFPGAGQEEQLLMDILNPDGTIDVEKLKRWTQDSSLDPQDPKHALIFEYISECSDQNVVEVAEKFNYFRCSPELQELEFCDMEELNRNIRFKMLELRDKNEPEFLGTVVPNRIKEISTSALAAYKKRVTESRGVLEDDNFDEEEEDTIEAKRARGIRSLKLIYTKILQQCKCVDHNLEYEDVVNERMVKHVETVIRTVTYNVLNWFKLQPSISKPLPKLLNTKTLETVQEFASIQPKILITLVSGVNIPQRPKKKDDPNEVVRPFVVVSYSNQRVQSTVSSGADPIWNEDLCLNLQSTDLSNEDVLNKSVCIDLFDQTRVQVYLEEADFNVFLGSIRIPISAVSSASKIGGFFRVSKPSVILGHDQDTSRKSSCVNVNDPTYLNLSITIEPNVPKIHPNMEELLSSEPPYLRHHILNWNRNFNANYPSRRFSALVLDANGKTVCATRFITPLEPPQINRDGFDATPHQCARFVSAIPFTETNNFYDNVWLTTEQLLKLSIGSIFDHAVALTCYLLALNMDVWLTIAFGLPHGLSAYVLVREFNREAQDNQFYFYDVVTGNKHNFSDTFMPIQSVYCVINGNNIWANVQRSDNVAAMRFDLSRRGDWLPLFNNETTAPTNKIQTKLHYWSDLSMDGLEKRLEKRIRRKIMKLRKLERTVWNHSLSALFKKTISSFEFQIINNAPNLEVHSEIRSFLLSHNVQGFVFNAPYKSANAAADLVKSTGAHTSSQPDVEYIMSVHLHPYSNHVIVAWIMVGVMGAE